MGKITEQQQWEEDIYLIEKQDKVLGGELGVINIQAKQLANRTKYLKDQVEGINRDRTDYAPKASPAFTGIPTAPTAAAGTNNAQIATTAFVKSAIAALVGSAPAALDTLEELAQALSGETNIKATLLAEIGKKANISHTHTVSQITDFNQSVREIVTQSITQGFSQNLAETGWCKLPNGLIFQWGKFNKGYGSVRDEQRLVTFPITFPNKVLFVGLTEFTNAWSYSTTVENRQRMTNSGFYVISQRNDSMYFALGF